ncbi:hypothetical protein SLA2020_335600 [Shorea laevis]
MNDLFSGSFSRFRGEPASPDHHVIEMSSTAPQFHRRQSRQVLRGRGGRQGRAQGVGPPQPGPPERPRAGPHPPQRQGRQGPPLPHGRRRLPRPQEGQARQGQARGPRPLQRRQPEPPGCGPGSSSDRTRTSVVNGLRKKLKDSMDSFNGLRQQISSEYRETVQRRYFTVTGENPDDKTVDLLISTGESETFLQRAIQEQGRGRVLDTIHEIQERHDAVKEMEKNLKELHQVFLDMAVLVQAQGEQLDDIESHVGRANSFVRGGTQQLQTARVLQKNTRKWTCYAIIILLVIILFVVLFTVRPWEKNKNSGSGGSSTPAPPASPPPPAA